jgi:hypothetical protein
MTLHPGSMRVSHFDFAKRRTAEDEVSQKATQGIKGNSRVGSCEEEGAII